MLLYDVILKDTYEEYDAFLYTLLYLDFCTFDEKLLIKEWANPVTLKKIMYAESDPRLDIVTEPVEPLKTVYEKADAILDVIATGQETLTYYNDCDPLLVPVEVGDMNLLYRRYGEGSAQLAIQVGKAEATLYHLFYADTELLRVDTTLAEDGVIVYKYISGESTLPIGVLWRKARLDDYNDVSLRVLGTYTLDELSRVKPRTVLTMTCTSEPVKLCLTAGDVEAVTTKVG